MMKAVQYIFTLFGIIPEMWSRFILKDLAKAVQFGVSNVHGMRTPYYISGKKVREITGFIPLL